MASSKVEDVLYEAPPVDIPSPPWSLTDRQQRHIIIFPWRLTLLRSSLLLLSVYVPTLIFILGLDAYPGHELYEAPLLLVFVVWHLIVVLATAIPDPSTSNAQINARTNGSIFLAMVLYPCLGLWVVERETAWDLRNIEYLWVLEAEDEWDGKTGYTWGQVFPFLLWGMSACLELKRGYSGFTQDHQGVATADDGRSTTSLYRREPHRTERILVRLLRWCMFSLWDVTPDDHRPAGGAGRFVCQLVSPMVLLFEYTAFRFCRYALQNFGWVYRARHSGYMPGARHWTELSSPERHHILARLILWSGFLLFTVLLRALLASELFLVCTVPDEQTRKQRRKSWQAHLCESKRMRVLWGMRGFTSALVPLLAAVYGDTIASTGALMWYLYLAVYLSFFWEGVGAFFFGLELAERGCELRTPLALLAKWSFWLSYNSFLQPVGTGLNLAFWVLNREYRRRQPLHELFGPLLDREGNFIYQVRWLLMARVREPTADEIEERLRDWQQTYRRVCLANGHTDAVCTTVPAAAPHPGGRTRRPPPGVFNGSMLPRREEWLAMRDGEHARDCVPLLSFERDQRADKFHTWYPACREEVLSLICRPYSFEATRVIFMFGYGSLLSPESPPAGLTADQRKQLLPYWLCASAGYRRTWNFRHGAANITALGLEPVADGEVANDVCGCIYPIDYEKAVDLFAEREQGYELLFVHESHLQPMHPDFRLPKGVGYVWICGVPTADATGGIDDKRHSPTVEYPILQSYVDAIMVGALRYASAGVGSADGMRFAAALVQSIDGWDHAWMNDRLVPGRPWAWRPEYALIDGLLSSCPTSEAAFRKRLWPQGQIADSWADVHALEHARWKDWRLAFFGTAEEPGFDGAVVVGIDEDMEDAQDRL